MNDEDLKPHKSAMEKDGYILDAPRFEKLKQWNGVIFQIISAMHYLDQLKAHKPDLGNLQDTYRQMSLIYAFTLQYSKCYTQAGRGQTTLDATKVFKPASESLVAHKRIIDIRHNLVAHNGNTDLALSNLAVKELEDRFIVKHFLTFAMPMNELEMFTIAIEDTYAYTVKSLNKYMGNIGDKYGKPVYLDDED